MNKLHPRFALTLIIVTAVLSGCASRPPLPLSSNTIENINVVQVQADPTRFTGKEIRWGGVIAKVDNHASQTWVEVVSQPLWESGEPQTKGSSSGRFIASFAGFVDPMVYSNGRLLTVVGAITDVSTRPIGEYNYNFPMVAVTASHLWPIEAEVSPSADFPSPWWYYDTWPLYSRPYPYLHPRYRW